MAGDPQWQQCVQAVYQHTKPSGLDLVEATQCGHYNRAVDPRYRVEDFGTPSSALLVVGNTKALWPAFIAAYRDPNNTELVDAPNPLDLYIENAITSACEAAFASDYRLRFAHREPIVAIQKLAALAGLAPQTACHLNVHPEYGPWIGLRAAITIETDGPRPRADSVPSCDCDLHCRPVLEQTLAAADTANWQSWFAVRDACPIGRQHRYSDAQIRYHYTKDRSVLTADTTV